MCIGLCLCFCFNSSVGGFFHYGSLVEYNLYVVVHTGTEDSEGSRITNTHTIYKYFGNHISLSGFEVQSTVCIESDQQVAVGVMNTLDGTAVLVPVNIQTEQTRQNFGVAQFVYMVNSSQDMIMRNLNQFMFVYSLTVFVNPVLEGAAGSCGFRQLTVGLTEGNNLSLGTGVSKKLLSHSSLK